MRELNEYEITINGLPHTVQLSPEDAKRAGKEAVLIDRMADAQAELDRQAEAALAQAAADAEAAKQSTEGAAAKAATVPNKAAAAGASK